MSGNVGIGPMRLEVWIDVPADQAEAVMAALPLHVELSRAEPGCLRFDAEPDLNVPGRVVVREDYVDEAAFEAHKARNRASAWFTISADCPRTIKVLED